MLLRLFLLLVSLPTAVCRLELSLLQQLSPRPRVIAAPSAVAMTAFVRSQVVRAIPVAIVLAQVIAAKAAVAAILVIAAIRRVLPAPRPAIAARLGPRVVKPGRPAVRNLLNS